MQSLHQSMQKLLHLACNHLHTPVSEEQAQTFADKWLNISIKFTSWQVFSSIYSILVILSWATEQNFGFKWQLKQWYLLTSAMGMAMALRWLPLQCLCFRLIGTCCESSWVAGSPLLLPLLLGCERIKSKGCSRPKKTNFSTWGVTWQSSCVRCGASQTCFFAPWSCLNQLVSDHF